MARRHPLEKIWKGGRAFKETAIEALLVSVGLLRLGIAKAGLFYNSMWNMFLLQVGEKLPLHQGLVYPFLLE